jgi:hypothetical protein
VPNIAACGRLSRKYRFPVGGLMLTVFVVPLSLTVLLKLDQPLGLPRSLLCCNTNRVEGDGQAMITVVAAEFLNPRTRARRY